MIKDFYPVNITQHSTCFTFDSKGTKGLIPKWIAIFSKDGKTYNLAFGDIVNQKLADEVISGNNDARKVLRTVIHALQLFFEKYPRAIVYFDGVDERRTRLYNSIISHKLQELSKVFIIEGQVDNNTAFEQIDTIKTYHRFKIKWKSKNYPTNLTDHLSMMKDIVTTYETKKELSPIELLGKAYEEGRIITTKTTRIAKREAMEGLHAYFKKHPDCKAMEALIATLNSMSPWYCEEFVVELSAFIMDEYKFLKYGKRMEK